VFEHGYLIGKLGRKRVSALIKGNTETPGDISGVVYITMDDAGAWKMTLAKEMINAGRSVNMNEFCS
jgi:predicted nucleotide-binding protein